MSDEEDEQWGMAIHEALDALDATGTERSIGHGRLGPIDDLGPGWIDMDTETLGRALRVAGWTRPERQQ